MSGSRVDIRSDGTASNKTAFVVLAILPDDTRDSLRLCFQANEGTKFYTASFISKPEIATHQIPRSGSS
ncbi:MAG: hypothetical protein LKE90_08305 [Acetobacter sp.]|nr:hypothetical protein [Acetobacter sp.]